VGAAVSLAAACGSPTSTSSPAAPTLDGQFRATALGELRTIAIRGERYTLQRFAPCEAKEGEPKACVEEGSITVDAKSIVFRERVTSRTATLPLEIIETRKSSPLATAMRPATSAKLVDTGAPLQSGDRVEVFRTGGQEFHRTQLITTEGARLLEPCANLDGHCMQRSACGSYGESRGMWGMNHLWAGDCNFDRGEICCVLAEKWTPCHELAGTCELPGACEFPRQFVPAATTTNCGDALRPGTTCCIEPLTS
jgi:hypothetical protein